MLPMLAELLQVTPNAEPIVQGALVVGGGGVLVWFAKTMVELRDGFRSMTQTLTDPRTGLLITVDKHALEIETVKRTVGRVVDWHNEADERLAHLERRVPKADE